MAYASQQAHSSAERAGLLGGVKVRLLTIDEDFSLRGETLEKAIQEDKDKVRNRNYTLKNQDKFFAI